MELIAQKRKELGKETKKLRRERKLPAVLYGKNMDSTPVCVDAVRFDGVYASCGTTNLVDLNVDGDIARVLINEVQYHPVSDKPIHVNFHKVNLKEKVRADIPVELVNEEANPLIKSGDALALLLLSEISIEALPTDLPDSFIVDVSGLTEIGDAITVSQLQFDRSKVTLDGYEDTDFVVKLDYAVTQEEDISDVSEEDMLEKLEATEENKETSEDVSEATTE